MQLCIRYHRDTRSSPIILPLVDGPQTPTDHSSLAEIPISHGILGANPITGRFGSQNIPISGKTPITCAFFKMCLHFSELFINLKRTLFGLLRKGVPGNTSHENLGKLPFLWPSKFQQSNMKGCRLHSQERVLVWSPPASRSDGQGN